MNNNKKIYSILIISLMLITTILIGILKFQSSFYEKYFLAHIGYVSQQEFELESYLNNNLKNSDHYYESGKKLIEKSSYKNSYHSFLEKNLYNEKVVVVFSFTLIYIIFVSLFASLFFNLNKCKKDIIINLDNIKENKQITIKDEIGKKMKECKSYIQYQINKKNEEKEFMYQFIMYVTHQLKTPLTALGLMIENQSLVYCFNDIQLIKQVNKINHIISKLLNQGKLEAGKIDMHIEKNDINVLINDILEDIKEMLEYKNITLFINNDDGIGYYDEYWLKEAIVNILKNCIEHSNFNSSLKMNIHVNSNLEIVIVDQAGGIEDIEKIFERYYTNNSQKGVGIGMYLSHLIVNKHFGELNVKNVECGSQFEILIPYKMIM